MTGKAGSTRYFSAAAAALLLLAGCSNSGSSDPSSSAESTPAPSVSVAIPTAAMSAPNAAEFDKAITEVFEQAGDFAKLAPGTWVGVWDPKKGVFTKSYGNATLDGQPADLEQHVRIGSVSKTFTAVAALLLVDDGKLALDDTVAKLLPDLAAKYPAYAAVTIEQLLRMQSGVPDYLNRPDGLVADVAANPQRIFTVDEILTAATTGDMGKPGEIGYSSTNYVVLEEMVNKLSGMTLQEFIAKRITGPLGMTQRALPTNEGTNMPEAFAHGYITGPETSEFGGCRAEFADVGAKVAQDTDTADWGQSLTRGAGGMYSTVHDLGIWAASTSGNVLLCPELQAKRLQITKDPTLPYGMGILEEEIPGQGTFIGHEGDAFGYQAFVLTDPGTGTSVVVANNTCGLPILMTAIIGALPLGK